MSVAFEVVPVYRICFTLTPRELVGLWWIKRLRLREVVNMKIRGIFKIKLNGH